MGFIQQIGGIAVKTKQEQELALKAIMDKYEPEVRTLYRDILALVTQKSAYSTKKGMRDEILDKVKGAIK